MPLPSERNQAIWARNVQTDVYGGLSDPPPGSLPLPSAIAPANIDLASSLNGLLTDTRAAMQAIKKVMAEMAIQTQRSNAMGAGGHQEGPNNGASFRASDAMGASMSVVRMSNNGVWGGAGAIDSALVANLLARSQGVPILGMGTQYNGFASTSATSISSGVVSAGGGAGNHHAGGGSSGGGNPPPSPPNPSPPTNTPPHRSQIGFNKGYSVGQSGSIREVAQHVYTRIYSEAPGADEAAAGVKKALGTVATGDALSTLGGEALAGPVGEAAAAVGLIAGAITWGGDRIAALRGDAAEYQSVRGGSEASGFGEYLHEQAFRYSQLGTLSPNQATQLFQGTADIGLRGAKQKSALTFAVTQYKTLGASISTSLKVISIAAQGSQMALDKVGESLIGVTQTAAQAGVNANFARQQFTTTYGDLVGHGITSSNASLTAQTFTNIGLSRATGGNLNGLISSNKGIALQAAQYMRTHPGATPADYGNLITSKGGAALQAQMVAEILHTQLGVAAASSPEGGKAIAMLQAGAAKYGGNFTKYLHHVLMHQDSPAYHTLNSALPNGMTIRQLEPLLEHDGGTIKKPQTALTIFAHALVPSSITEAFNRAQKEQNQKKREQQTPKQNLHKTLFMQNQSTAFGNAYKNILAAAGLTMFRATETESRTHTFTMNKQLKRIGITQDKLNAEYKKVDASKTPTKTLAQWKQKAEKTAKHNIDVKIKVEMSPSTSKFVKTTVGSAIPSSATLVPPNPYPTRAN
jgi:hypothetical protein